MPQATVKSFFPDKRYGFLINPEGGKDIFFHLDDQHRKFLGTLVPIVSERRSLPKPGRWVEIIRLEPDPKGVRASVWRLL